MTTLQAREAGVLVLFGDRRVLAGELPDDSGPRHFDAVGVDTERIVVVQFLGQVVQRRLHRVLRQHAGDLENLQIEPSVTAGLAVTLLSPGIPDDAPGPDVRYMKRTSWSWHSLPDCSPALSALDVNPGSPT